MKNFSIILVLVLVSCAKGPLRQVDQARNNGGLFKSFSNRVVVDSQLVTDGQNFYYGTRKGDVFSIRSKNVRKNWERTLSSSIDTSVLVDESRAYVGTGDGKVYALDAKTGKKLWEAQLTAPARGRLTKVGSIIMVGTNDGVLFALQSDNGQVQWKYREEPYEKMKIQFFVEGSVEQNRLFVGFPNGQIAALDVQTGVEIWKQWMPNSQSRFYDISSILLIPEKGILVTSVDGPSTLFSFAGQAIWSYSNASTQAAPVLVQDRILMATKDRIVWLDREGQEKGSIPYTKSLRPSGVLYKDSLIYVSSLDGSLHVFNEKEWLWEYEMGISIQGSPIALDQNVWMLNRRGQIIGMKRR